MSDRFAVISDPHANLEGLRAVLDDIAALGVAEIICLGDLVGRGPDPVAVVDLVRERCSVVLKGLTEGWVCGEFVPSSSPSTTRSVEWAGQRLREADGADARDRMAWLDARVSFHVRHADAFTHGTPRESMEYIQIAEFGFEQSEHHRTKYEQIHAGFERRLFVGNAHQQLAVVDGSYRSVEGLGRRLATDSQAKTIIGVGSAGWPVDRDRRAGWVLVEDELVSWRRVAYDVTPTVAKIRATPELHDQFARRLLEGI